MTADRSLGPQQVLDAFGRRKSVALQVKEGLPDALGDVKADFLSQLVERNRKVEFAVAQEMSRATQFALQVAEWANEDAETRKYHFDFAMDLAVYESEPEKDGITKQPFLEAFPQYEGLDLQPFFEAVPDWELALKSLPEDLNAKTLLLQNGEVPSSSGLLALGSKQEATKSRVKTEKTKRQ